MITPIRALAAACVLAAALVPAASAGSPPQTDAVVAIGAAGSPTANGCPASSIRLATAADAIRSSEPSVWNYPNAGAADANGNGYVCAIALPDAARDAQVPPQFEGIAYYVFVDDNGPAAVDS